MSGCPEKYEALAVDSERRVGLFNEGLAVLRILLQGEPAQLDGEWYRLANATVRPGADVPVLIGAVVPGALQRAGRSADGWIMAPLGTLDDFARSWRIVRDAALVATRLVAGRLIYTSVDDDPDKARAELEEFLVGSYGPAGGCKRGP